MSTPEMSDDELDALLRQGAERFPDEQSLAEWWRLQEKMQAHKLEQQVRRRVRRVLAAELLLLGLGVLLWLAWPTVKPAAPHPQQPLLAAGPATPEPAVLSTRQQRAGRRAPGAARLASGQRPVADGPAAATDHEPRPAAEMAAAEPARAARPNFPTAHASEHLAILSPERTRRRAAGDRRATTSLTASSLLFQPPARRAALTYWSPEGRRAPRAARPARPDVGRLPAAAPPPAGVPAGAAAPASAGPAALTAGFPATDSLPGIAARVAGPVLSPVPALLAGQPVAADVPSRPSAPIYRLSILLVGAAELSAVHLARLMPPGQSVGLQAEYRLGARLRVSTGVLRTNQIFDVRGADYHLPAGTAAPGATLQWVAGTAQVLDIPLNLRYDLLARPRSGWFASAGLSSVLMRGEHYRYDYLVNGQPEEQEASQVNGSRHPFSTLNLSMGYERALGSGPWSAQVAPFAKLPLRGVGMGQAMVSSIGVQLGIKYGLLPVRAPRH